MKRPSPPARGNRRRPPFQRTARQLGAILRRTEPGEFLPSEPALAQRLGVSRATLREAMRSLEDRGVIVRRQGVGTYVARTPPVMEAGLEVLESLETLARKNHLPLEMGELIVEEIRLASGEDPGISVRPGESIVRVARVIQAQGRPVAYLVDVVPRHILAPEEVRGGFRGSVLDLLLTRGQPRLAHSRTEISALAAPPDLARRMQVLAGECLLCLRAVLFTETGEAIDRSESYFLPGPFRFHVVRSVGRPV